MNRTIDTTHCCLGLIARTLACFTRCFNWIQELLNTIWYRFALYAARTAGKWPNYTTGELSDIPEVRYSVRRGRIEMVQTYEFDHTGQGPHETVV